MFDLFSKGKIKTNNTFVFSCFESNQCAFAKLIPVYKVPFLIINIAFYVFITFIFNFLIIYHIDFLLVFYASNMFRIWYSFIQKYGHGFLLILIYILLGLSRYSNCSFFPELCMVTHFWHFIYLEVSFVVKNFSFM